MSPTPAAHHHLRVYYEDTDAGGVVYHAAYIRFFERGRAEWLRQCGFAQRDIAAATGVLFAVKTLHVEYKKPAMLDDWLTVQSCAARRGRSRIHFNQQLLREEEPLALAQVEIVCVAGNPFRAVAIPPSLQALL